MAKLTKEQRQELAGIPDSRPHIDPETAEQENPLLDLHMGGVPIREMLPMMGPAWLAAINYHQTDEAIAERNKGKVESAARVTASSDFDKKLHQWGDSFDTAMQPWEQPNPQKILEQRHLTPGFRPRWLSMQSVDKRARGLRGWRPVRDQETGEVVKLGTLFLGEMPEELAERRNQKYREIGNANLRRQQEKQSEEHAKAVRDGQGGFGPLPSNESFSGRVAVGMAPHDAESYQGHNPTATMGLRQHRGNSLAE